MTRRIDWNIQVSPGEKGSIIIPPTYRARDDLMRPASSSQATRKKTRVQFDLTMPRGE